VLEPGDAEFAELIGRFPPRDGVRAVIHVELLRISDSCGYGVPLMRYVAEREQLGAWVQRKGADGLRAYQLEHNAKSLDGLPALRGETLRAQG
jgi:hypothetical protein